MEGFPQRLLLQHFLGVRRGLRRVGNQPDMGVGLALSGCPPEGAGDRRDSIGAEGDPAGGVIAAQGPPEGNAAHLDGLGVGECSSPLLAHDPVHQPGFIDSLNHSCRGWPVTFLGNRKMDSLAPPAVGMPIVSSIFRFPVSCQGTLSLPPGWVEDLGEPGLLQKG